MEDKIRYKEILLPSKEPFSKYQIGDSNSISPLSLINIFIGTNNSGKSRLLRALFSLEKLSYNTNIYTENDFRELIHGLDQEFTEVFSSTIKSVLQFNSDYFKVGFPSFDPENINFISADNSTYIILKEKLENLIGCEFKSGAYSTVPNNYIETKTRTNGVFPANVVNTGNKLREIGVKYIAVPFHL